MPADRVRNARYWIPRVAFGVALGMFILAQCVGDRHPEMGPEVRFMVKSVLRAYRWDLFFGGGWAHSLDEQKPRLEQCTLPDRLVFYRTVMANCEIADNGAASTVLYELVEDDAVALTEHLNQYTQTERFARMTKAQQDRIRLHAEYLKTWNP